MSANESNKQEKLSLKELSGSVVAAAIGVQSSENRKRDFGRGRPYQFVIAGILATALFVGSVMLTVNLIV